MNKKQFVKDLRDGEDVSTSFWVKFMAVPLAKSGKPYINLELMDKTGAIGARIWDDVETLRKSFDQGDYVRVEGAVLDYQGTLQIKVYKAERLSADEVQPGDYFPASTKNPDEMLAKLKGILATIENQWVKKLVFSFLEDAGFAVKFSRAPAAKSFHHAFIHGLLEHTLSIAMLAERVSEHYPELNRDLLLAGAFLHDIGKIDELAYERGFDYSDEGRLIGHITIASEWIGERARAIEGFPKEIETILKHLVLSHHGVYEFGSPRKPKIIEAMVINYIDELDAYVNIWQNALAEIGKEQDWSGYNKLLDRYVRKTPNLSAEEEKNKEESSEKPKSEKFSYRPFADLLADDKEPINGEERGKKRGKSGSRPPLTLFENNGEKKKPE
ncbi:MAG: HD domain-containing protein [Myxococcota bacterium]